MDITAWLAELGLGRYAAAFLDNDVDAEVLANLTPEDLTALGVTSVGHRRKLLWAIEALRASEADADADAATQPQAERRQLTALFCDMVGSTALSVRLNPEVMREVLREYQGACTRVITQYDGTVANFVGDGLLAYFGWPRAHEDDAERAVQAGLALVDAVGALRVPGADPLSVRVGISTGPVVVGDLISGGPGQAHSAVGETPTLAAGLQGLALPGQVLLGESTRRLLGEAFELRPLGMHSLHGIAQPVAAFLVEGRRVAESRFDARSGPVPSAMLGRQYEMAVLTERWALAQAGDGQAVLLVGEAGIGKSRLALAMLDAAARQPHVRMRYQCSPYHTDSPLWPVIQHLVHAIGLQPEQPLEASLARLEALFDQAGGNVNASVIAALIGLDGSARYGRLQLDEQELRLRTLEALVGQMLRLSTRQPVLMTVEDVHWIDPTTCELIERTLERIAGSRLLILLTSRPDHEPRLGVHPLVTRMTLNRLPRSEAEAIVARLGRDRLSPDTVKTIVARTDGVPLFVEELTKAVLEAGDTNVPSSLHDSLMARLDRVPQARDVAQIAACIGREFDHALLANIADRPADALDDAIGQLIRTELIFARGAPPSAHYTFKHALVQDVAYESLLRSKRQALHARILQVLEADAAASRAEVLARHATGAGLVDKAIGYWQQAGEAALQQSAYHEAASHLSGAIKLIEGQPDVPQRRAQQFALQMRYGVALMATQGYGATATRGAYARAHTLYLSAEKIDDQVLRTSMFYGLWTVVFVRGELAESVRQAEEFLAQALNGRDDAVRLIAHRMVGTCRLTRGDLVQARSHLERASGLCDLERDSGFVAQVAGDIFVAVPCHLAQVLSLLGHGRQGAAAFESAQALAARITRANARANSHFLACVTGVVMREAETVRRYAELLAAVGDEHRLPMWQANASAFRAWSDLEQGRLDEALSGYESSLPRLEALGQRLLMPSFLSHHAVALAASGRADEARGRSQQAIVESDRTTERWCEAELWRMRGEVFLHSAPHDGAEAVRCFERALAIARARGALLHELRAATRLSRFLAEQGERHKAHDLLAPIHGGFTETFESADLVEARALLASLAS